MYEHSIFDAHLVQPNKTFKMKSIIRVALVLVSMGLVLQSCEEEFAAPSVTLDNTDISAKAGEEITIIATVTAPAGFSKLTVQKFWDDTEEGSPSEVTDLTDGKYSFFYTVTEDDVEPILKFRFTAIDNDGQASTPVEAVVDVELTWSQILVKYDWAHTGYIRKKTSTNDISTANADDVYRFNADGSFELSMGTEYDGYEDFHHYCYWKIDETAGTLTLSWSDLNDTWTAYDKHVEETYTIATITQDKIEGDITIEGLDAIDPDYDASEDFTKVWSAQAKSSNFDPYKPGPDDDAGRDGAVCQDI